MIDRPMYVNEIMVFYNKPFVKILTGSLRSGKSTILLLIMKKIQNEYNILPEQILSYRFDSMEYSDMSAKDIYLEIKNHLYASGKTYIFLDEVQEIENWEKVVNSLYSDFDVDIYVTGSNSKMMASEISTYLTGRYVSFHIYTLSFREYLTFISQYKTVNNPRNELIDYIQRGGFPATRLYNQTSEEVYTTVRYIYNSTIYGDIIKRNDIRKVDQLERIIKYTFQNVGNTFSSRSISNHLKSEQRKIDNETVYSYLGKLEKAYLLHRCSRYDIQGKEILKHRKSFI